MQRIVWMIALLLLIVASVNGQEIAVVSPELQAQLDEIEAHTSEIRQLDRISPTDLYFPTKDELAVYLTSELAEEFAPEELADDLLFYVGLDLLEADIDLYTVLLDFLIDQVAGFYDPETKDMNVILISGKQPEDELPILEEIFYSHEYVHALQDQYFDLGKLIDNLEDQDNSDYQLAIQSLFEGDATQAMTEYMLILADENPLGFALSVLGGGVESGSLTIPDSVPDIIADELLFPYLQGQSFVATLKQNGGWEMVNAAYTLLPQSTEHIYHPDRYVSGDMPIDVNLPDILTLALDSNWRLAQDTVVGEFYLRQYLNTQLERDLLVQMATGWGGDKMLLYTNDATGDLVWVMAQAWDTPTDATEFVDGFVQFLDLRFDGNRDGDCWSGAEDAMCFKQVSDTETHITFAMDSPLAQQLMLAAG